MKERIKSSLIINGIDKSTLTSVCRNCLHYDECQPSFSSLKVQEVQEVQGYLVNVPGKCLLFQGVGATRGPVYWFVETPEGSLVEVLPKPKEVKKIYEIKDRQTLAVLCCLSCPVVSICKPQYDFSDSSVIKVRGGKINSKDCLLKK